MATTVARPALVLSVRVTGAHDDLDLDWTDLHRSRPIERGAEELAKSRSTTHVGNPQVIAITNIWRLAALLLLVPMAIGVRNGRLLPRNLTQSEQTCWPVWLAGVPQQPWSNPVKLHKMTMPGAAKAPVGDQHAHWADHNSPRRDDHVRLLRRPRRQRQPEEQCSHTIDGACMHASLGHRGNTVAEKAPDEDQQAHWANHTFHTKKGEHVRLLRCLCRWRQPDEQRSHRSDGACEHASLGRRRSTTCLLLQNNQEGYRFKPPKQSALTPHRVRPCRRGRKHRKRWRYPQMRFNSTLGFPGEGPKIATWNARGLAETRKVAAMLRRAKSSGWDALLVQEVKWTKQSESAAERIARVCEYDMYASRGSSGHQGGSAVFIRRDSATVKVRSKPKKDMKGYCAVPVLIEGVHSRLVSIYVPGEARLQSWFLRELK